MSQKALQRRWPRTPPPRGPTPRKRDLGREGFWEWSMEPVQARGQGCPPGPPRAQPTRVLQSPRVASSHMHWAVMTDKGLRPRGPGYTPRAAILALWSARRRGLRRLPSSARRSDVREDVIPIGRRLPGEPIRGRGALWRERRPVGVCVWRWLGCARERGRGYGRCGTLPLETD